MDIIPKILEYINSHDTETVDSIVLSKFLNVDHQVIVGAIKSIESLGNIISCEQVQESAFQLTNEGDSVLTNGSHEFRVFSMIPSEGILQSIVLERIPNGKIGVSKAVASKWIKISKDSNNNVILERLVDCVEDNVRQALCNCKSGLSAASNNITSELKKRKLITEVKRTKFVLKPGPSFTLDVKKEETDISPEMISSGKWKTVRFKAYNFGALGSSLPCGHLHPLLRVRSEFCKILCDMGFTEMPTNNYIECSFWNFDSLFQPQQHPARDAHDTFFLSDPIKTDLSSTAPKDYIDRVRTVHSRGAFGSRGYQSEWLDGEAEKNLLRTHTTAVSARMLYALAQQNPVVPVRYFSIDRVFRNETLDATHLAEFHQVEGLIADYGLSLGHLKAVIRTFFSKLGLTKLRFKPAYNPYTEPSMEVFAFHPGLQKWVEIGNSGIFRPEMLRPMGLPEGLTVIAWGLSLERPTMIMYGYKNIRDLIGPKVDLNMIYNAPLCRMEKF